MIRGYTDIKALAREIGCSVHDLLALAPSNDPFYAGIPYRDRAGQWFAEIWERFGFTEGVHLRRIHYVLISQTSPVLTPDGTPYLNTADDWKYLGVGSLAARYHKLVPAEAFIDRRNPNPKLYAKAGASGGAPWAMLGGARPDFGGSLPEEIDLPALYPCGFRANQAFLVEIWVEKSTQDDILDPLAQRLGCNLITGVGEMSEVAARNFVGRAADCRKPTRILYVSDFDPKGREMPVSLARKIEFILRDAELDLDIELHPIALTPDQCEQYRLPRAPIEKRGNGHADRFEQRFGEGATELDALEALHPGELAKIVKQEVCRYIDPTLDSRVWAAEHEAYAEVGDIEDAVHDNYRDRIDAFQQRYDTIREDLDALSNDGHELWSVIASDLRDQAPSFTTDDLPEPRDPEPIEAPLFSSKRSYLEQLDHYRVWQRRAGMP
jgi:hypothetical protein